jgi:hypothetical protein
LGSGFIHGRQSGPLPPGSEGRHRRGRDHRRFMLFTEKEITRYFEQAGFLLEFIEGRNPYDFEMSNERIFAIGMKK